MPQFQPTPVTKTELQRQILNVGNLYGYTAASFNDPNSPMSKVYFRYVNSQDYQQFLGDEPLFYRPYSNLFNGQFKKYQIIDQGGKKRRRKTTKRRKMNKRKKTNKRRK
jgi:hypothetical protein